MKNDAADANVLANQKAWMADLQNFLTKYPDADEAPDVLLQLASANEFNGEEEAGAQAVRQGGRDLPRDRRRPEGRRLAPPARAGGQVAGAEGHGPPERGGRHRLSTRGKTVLVVFWASWATPVKAELPELKKIAAKYRDRGLEVIGVNLDNERAEVDAFLKANPLSWPQIFEGGGIEGRLAVEYGITSVPTMFLADAQGKVVNRNIRTSADADRQLEKVLGDKKAPAGVALDQRRMALGTILGGRAATPSGSDGASPSWIHARPFRPGLPCGRRS